METSGNQGSARRVAPRYPASMPCAVLWDGGEVEATLIDLSLSGAAVVAHAVPVEMRGADLSLALESNGEAVSLVVDVVRVEKEPFGGILLRLKFRKLGFEQARPLARLVTELRRDFNQKQAELASDRIGHPFPSRIPQYPPRDRQK